MLADPLINWDISWQAHYPADDRLWLQSRQQTTTLVLSEELGKPRESTIATTVSMNYGSSTDEQTRYSSETLVTDYGSSISAPTARNIYSASGYGDNDRGQSTELSSSSDSEFAYNSNQHRAETDETESDTEESTVTSYMSTTASQSTETQFSRMAAGGDNNSTVSVSMPTSKTTITKVTTNTAAETGTSTTTATTPTVLTTTMTIDADKVTNGNEKSPLTQSTQMVDRKSYKVTNKKEIVIVPSPETANTQSETPSDKVRKVTPKNRVSARQPLRIRETTSQRMPPVPPLKADKREIRLVNERHPHFMRRSRCFMAELERMKLPINPKKGAVIPEERSTRLWATIMVTPSLAYDLFCTRTVAAFNIQRASIVLINQQSFRRAVAYVAPPREKVKTFVADTGAYIGKVHLLIQPPVPLVAKVQKPLWHTIKYTIALGKHVAVHYQIPSPKAKKVKFTRSHPQYCQQVSTKSLLPKSAMENLYPCRALKKHVIILSTVEQPDTHSVTRVRMDDVAALKELDKKLFLSSRPSPRTAAVLAQQQRPSRREHAHMKAPRSKTKSKRKERKPKMEKYTLEVDVSYDGTTVDPQQQRSSGETTGTVEGRARAGSRKPSPEKKQVRHREKTFEIDPRTKGPISFECTMEPTPPQPREKKNVDRKPNTDEFFPVEETSDSEQSVKRVEKANQRHRKVSPTPERRASDDNVPVLKKMSPDFNNKKPAYANDNGNCVANLRKSPKMGPAKKSSSNEKVPEPADNPCAAMVRGKNKLTTKERREKYVKGKYRRYSGDKCETSLKEKK